ncbi:MAG: cyclic-di-AMP receptor [Firmicutes bacterium]|nr:cyclic-di-AMP receptor [Candidatus Colimorpha enterica]
MKLILAIVNNDDASDVSKALSAERISVTKISSTGGFLMNGNTTFLMGVDDDKVEKAMGIIAEHSEKRTINVPMDMRYQTGRDGLPVGTVIVGGATVFVLNVEECKRL